MHSHTVTLASLLLLVVTTLTATAQDSRLSSVQFRPLPSSDHFSMPIEKSDDDQAVFRLKETRPCDCLNGGRCQIRLRRCACALGFSGARCEIVDKGLLSGMDNFHEVGPSTSDLQQLQQQKMEHQQVVLGAARLPFNLADWLFYAPLFAALLLLFTLIRVFVILSKSYLSEKTEKQSLTVTVVAKPLPDNESIYTLPLPVQPPPYSEKAAACAAGPAHFVHSTPFRGNLVKEEAEGSSEYLCVKRLNEYALIV